MVEWNMPESVETSALLDNNLDLCVCFVCVRARLQFVLVGPRARLHVSHRPAPVCLLCATVRVEIVLGGPACGCARPCVCACLRARARARAFVRACVRARARAGLGTASNRRHRGPACHAHLALRPPRPCSLTSAGLRAPCARACVLARRSVPAGDFVRSCLMYAQLSRLR